MTYRLTILPPMCERCGGDHNFPGVTGTYILRQGRWKKWLPPSENGEAIEFWGSAGKYVQDDDFGRGIFYWRLSRTPEKWRLYLIHSTTDRAVVGTEYHTPVIQRNGEIQNPDENTEWQGEGGCPSEESVTVQIENS